MLFWEVRFKHTIEDDEGYPFQKNEEPNFFGTMEECMAYVLAQSHLNISNVEFTRRYLGTWKSQILLNDPNKEVKNND